MELNGNKLESILIGMQFENVLAAERRGSLRLLPTEKANWNLCAIFTGSIRAN